jgi:hypothetical protein
VASVSSFFTDAEILEVMMTATHALAELVLRVTE